MNGKKSFGAKPYLFPMPVLMIATYNKDGSVDVMNMAWGGICDSNKVALNIGAGHKTTENIAARKAFTISVADREHLVAADFFGIASGNTMPDKFERSGLTAVKSENVDAPVVVEFPITLECRVVYPENLDHLEGDVHIVGEIVNALASESVLDAQGNIDPVKVNAFVFDTYQKGYYAIGEKVGTAWGSGKALMK